MAHLAGFDQLAGNLRRESQALAYSPGVLATRYVQHLAPYGRKHGANALLALFPCTQCASNARSDDTDSIALDLACSLAWEQTHCDLYGHAIVLSPSRLFDLSGRTHCTPLPIRPEETGW